jgi:asparagine synthase (glutamine-hydrolysing)
VKTEEAIAVIPEVIKILESFDPAIPNDVTAYLGLKCAKDMGIDSMITGDGSDEIFAGYDFMLKIKDLEEYMARMHSVMQFSSNKIGDALGINIKQPFLDKEFMDFSCGIDVDLKIRRENGKTWGKWILRKAFEGVLPQEVLWQSKRPLEVGSGMTRLRNIIETRVADEEFETGNRSFPIKFRNKEHFYYYRIYKEVVGEIPAMALNVFHCRTCGDVSEWKEVK